MSGNYSQNEIKLGIFVALCLALFVSMFVTYGKVSPFWRARREITVVFENINSLRPDSPVRYNGFEVGRVKSLRIIHLDNENLERLSAAITRRNLDDLPLRSDTLKRELRSASSADFAPKIRAALQNRTMIELTLELMQEGDDKRFHVDDQVRIVDTIFGDTAVEIFSGNGAINSPTDPKLLLGTSGDFFSNLSKSLGEVREILSDVTALVGMQERKSFLDSQARLSSTAKRLENLTEFAKKRATVSAERLDKITGDASTAITAANKLLESAQPYAKQIGKDASAAMTSLKDKAAGLQTAQDETRKEIMADVQVIKDDVKSVMDRAEPNFGPLNETLHKVYDRVGGLSYKLDDFQSRAGWMYSESEPEFSTVSSALKKGMLNLQYFAVAAKENKDLVISRKDVGEHDYSTIMDAYRRMTTVMFRVRSAMSNVEDIGNAVPQTGLPVPLLTDAAKAERKLQEIHAPLDEVYQQIEERLLPRFERKKAAW